MNITDCNTLVKVILKNHYLLFTRAYCISLEDNVKTGNCHNQYCDSIYSSINQSIEKSTNQSINQ